MGKAKIIQHLGAGLYVIEVIRDTAAVDKKKTKLEKKVNELLSLKLDLNKKIGKFIGDANILNAAYNRALDGWSSAATKVYNQNVGSDNTWYRVGFFNSTSFYDPDPEVIIRDTYAEEIKIIAYVDTQIAAAYDENGKPNLQTLEKLHVFYAKELQQKTSTINVLKNERTIALIELARIRAELARIRDNVTYRKTEHVQAWSVDYPRYDTNVIPNGTLVGTAESFGVRVLENTPREGKGSVIKGLKGWGGDDIYTYNPSRNILPSWLWQTKAVFTPARDAIAQPIASEELATGIKNTLGMLRAYGTNPRYECATVISKNPNNDTQMTVEMYGTNINGWSHPDYPLTDKTKGPITLVDVTVEYMDNCGTSVFEVGDRVIVSYTGDARTGPKVIGFAKEPVDCSTCYTVGYVGLNGVTISGQASQIVMKGKNAKPISAVNPDPTRTVEWTRKINGSQDSYTSYELNRHDLNIQANMLYTADLMPVMGELFPPYINFILEPKGTGVFALHPSYQQSANVSGNIRSGVWNASGPYAIASSKVQSSGYKVRLDLGGTAYVEVLDPTIDLPNFTWNGVEYTTNNFPGIVTDSDNVSGGKFYETNTGSVLTATAVTFYTSNWNWNGSTGAFSSTLSTFTGVTPAQVAEYIFQNTGFTSISTTSVIRLKYVSSSTGATVAVRNYVFDVYDPFYPSMRFKRSPFNI